MRRDPTRRRHVTVAVALAAAATLAAGCGAATDRLAEQATERVVSAATDGEVGLDLRDGQVTIEGADGERVTGGAATAVPERIAAAISIPAGFEPVTTFEQHDGAQQGVTVAGTLVTDDPEAVLDDLGAALTADGWDQVSRTNLNGELLALALQRGDDLFNLSMVVDGGDTMLTIMLVEND
jgi:hypothetical protein